MRLVRLSWALALGAMALCVNGAMAAIAPANNPTGAPGSNFQECLSCPKMVVIPPGQVTVPERIFSDHPEDPGARPPYPGEKVPSHVVSVKEEFAVSKYPITKAEYSEFVADTSRKNPLTCRSSDGLQWEEVEGTDWENPGFPQTPEDPVVCVSWEDANAYVQWLNGRSRGHSRITDLGADGPYRLLTLPETEYIGAAQVQKLKNAGPSAFREAGNFGADKCDPCAGYIGGADKWQYTSPVGSFPPNELGLYDVLGNVWQLTDSPFPYGDKAPQEVGSRMAVGASWLDRPSRLLTPALSGLANVEGLYDIGFRVARTLKAAPVATSMSPIPDGSVKAGQKINDCAGCPELVIAAPGSFYMHQNIQPKLPLTLVTIPRPLAVGVYDVTKEQYAQFVKETGYAKAGGCQVNEHGDWWVVEEGRGWKDPGFKQTDRDPVTCVSWDDAHAYIDWLNTKAGFASNAKDGKGPHYRLPSGEEWEYLAKGGYVWPLQTFYWGSSPSHEYANYGLICEVGCGGMRQGADRWLYTSPVGSFVANSLGVYDGFGNVWQFTDDCSHKDYTGLPKDGSAWTEGGDCRFRAARGASYDDQEPTYFMDTFLTSTRNNANGFRVVRTIE